MAKKVEKPRGRAFSIDKHPQKREIIRDLVNQIPYLTISKKYPGLSESAVYRYANQRMAQKAGDAIASGEYDGQAMLDRVENTIAYVQKMYESLNEYLSDPDDPNRYSLASRAEEVEVIYTKHILNNEGEIEGKTRGKALLQELLDRGLRDDEEVERIYSIRRVEPAKLLLETASTLTKQLEILARIAGVIKETNQTTVNTNVVINHQAITNIVGVIEREVKDPEVVKRIVEALNE